MAQESLLRHIFKRGLISTKSKKAAHHVGDDNDPLLAIGSTKNIAKTASSYSPKAQDTVGAGAPVKTETRQHTRRDNNSCSSSCSSCSSDTETIHSTNIPMPITQKTSAPAFSISNLLHAVMEEANTATTMHMETLNTTLALLDAIQGMSATVDVLRREMEEKKAVCEEMKRELRSFEETVREMGLIE